MDPKISAHRAFIRYRLQLPPELKILNRTVGAYSRVCRNCTNVFSTEPSRDLNWVATEVCGEAEIARYYALMTKADEKFLFGTNLAFFGYHYFRIEQLIKRTQSHFTLSVINCVKKYLRLAHSFTDHIRSVEVV